MTATLTGGKLLSFFILLACIKKAPGSAHPLSRISGVRGLLSSARSQEHNRIANIRTISYTAKKHRPGHFTPSRVISCRFAPVRAVRCRATRSPLCGATRVARHPKWNPPTVSIPCHIPLSICGQLSHPPPFWSGNHPPIPHGGKYRLMKIQT